MRVRRAWIWLALLLLAACSSDNSGKDADGSAGNEFRELSSELKPLYEGSWAAFVAARPEVLQSMLAEDSEGGWVKLYNGDYPAAISAFSSAKTEAQKLGLARSHLREAELFQQAYKLAIEIDLRYLNLWTENASRLRKLDLDDLAAGATLLRAGKNEEALAKIRAFRKSAGGKDPSRGAIAAALEGEALAASGDLAGAKRVWKEKAVKADPVAAALAIGAMLEAGLDVKRPLELPVGESAYGRRSRLWALVQADELEAAVEIVDLIDFRASDILVTVATEEDGDDRENGGSDAAEGKDSGEARDLPAAGGEEGGSSPGAAGGLTRKFYDPLVLKALAHLHAKLALRSLGDDANFGAIYRARAEAILGRQPQPQVAWPTRVNEANLALFIFSDYPVAGDMAGAGERLAGQPAKTQGLHDLYLSHLDPIPAARGDGHDTRMAVVLAQKLQDAGQKVIEASKNDEGVNTVRGLRVVEKDLYLSLRKRALAYRDKERLLDALFLFERTFDKDSGKISYINDPGLYLRITELYTALGRYREALNYFYRLVQVRQEMWSIQESLGNLSVLGTVDNPGVSHRD